MRSAYRIKHLKYVMVLIQGYCIHFLQVRGFLLNFGVYHATRAALGLTFEWRLVFQLFVHWCNHFDCLSYSYFCCCLAARLWLSSQLL